MLIDDRIDFVIVNKIGMYTDLQDVENQIFYMRREPLKRVKVYMQLHKKHKDLIPKFRKAFESIHKDGTYQKNYSAFVNNIMNSFSQSLRVVKKLF